MMSESFKLNPEASVFVPKPDGNMIHPSHMGTESYLHQEYQRVPMGCLHDELYGATNESCTKNPFIEFMNNQTAVRMANYLYCVNFLPTYGQNLVAARYWLKHCKPKDAPEYCEHCEWDYDLRVDNTLPYHQTFGAMDVRVPGWDLPLQFNMTSPNKADWGKGIFYFDGANHGQGGKAIEQNHNVKSAEEEPILLHQQKIEDGTEKATKSQDRTGEDHDQKQATQVQKLDDDEDCSELRWVLDHLDL